MNRLRPGRAGARGGAVPTGDTEVRPEQADLDPRSRDRPVDQYADVDVALVAESTYPYLKGGVSAVMHDIVQGNPKLTFGILHIAWDSNVSKRDLYGMPPNVLWVRHIYLSMQDHREDFMEASPRLLNMRSSARLELAYRVFDAIAGIPDGHYEGLWELYDDGINPRTRSYVLWPILGTKEFMTAALERLAGLGLPFVDTFWLLREFFSLAYAILSVDVPKARVYHAHTTGYASLLGAVGARQNGTRFLLTEHNLYVRDTVNELLDRSMALPLTDRDWREFDVPPDKRAWMAWWTEMAHFAYPSAEVITYLYPAAVTEAADLGAPVEKSTIVPNGMQVGEFDGAYQQRQLALVDIHAEASTRTWNLAYIARVVPIKGLLDLIAVVDLLVKRGVRDFHLEILGPTDHAPDYYESCRARATELHLEEYVTFRGTVAVRELLGGFDLLVLPSYNEGQPIVVLEAMTAGIPVVGTDVGGMAQLITDTLVGPNGETCGPCGVLVTPGDLEAMADALQTAMSDGEAYAEYSRQARDRVTTFFKLDDVMGAYNQLYLDLGGIAEIDGRDPTVINLAAIHFIHQELAGCPPVHELHPTEANVSTMALIHRDAAGRQVPELGEAFDADVIAIRTSRRGVDSVPVPEWDERAERIDAAGDELADEERPGSDAGPGGDDPDGDLESESA